MRIYADLLARSYPFQYESVGQTVIMNRGADVNRIPGVSRGADSGNAVATPHVYFLNNALPTARGIASFHFQSVIDAPATASVDSIYFLRNTDGAAALFIPDGGTNHFYNSATNTWATFPVTVSADSKVSVAHLKGNVYICYSGVGLYLYNFVTAELEQVYPWGIEIEEILGVSAGNNYLILYSANRLYWTPAGLEPVGNLATTKQTWIEDTITDSAADFGGLLADLGGGLDYYAKRAGNNYSQIIAHRTYLSTYIASLDYFFMRYTSAVSSDSGSYSSYVSTAAVTAQADYDALNAAITSVTTEADTLYPSISGGYIYYIDFRPDLITGAGSTQVTAVRGKINAVLSLADGFIAYTDVNATAAQYSGNALNPFVFREIPAAAGALHADHVAYGIAQDAHIVWSPAGFQSVSFRQAENIWPELSHSLLVGQLAEINTSAYTFTSLLSAPAFEDISATETFSAYLQRTSSNPVETSHYSSLRVRMANVSSKYISISVQDGADPGTDFPVCFLYDITLGRFGRIARSHGAIFDFRLSAFSGISSFAALLADELATFENYITAPTFVQLLLQGSLEQKPVVGLVATDGEIFLGQSYTASLDTALFEANTSLAVLGKYKLIRDQGIKLLEVYAKPAFTGTLSVGLHDDVSNEAFFEALDAGDLPGEFYAFHASESVSLKFSGYFDLDAVSLEAENFGTRLYRTAGDY